MEMRSDGSGVQHWTVPSYSYSMLVRDKRKEKKD